MPVSPTSSTVARPSPMGSASNKRISDYDLDSFGKSVSSSPGSTSSASSLSHEEDGPAPTSFHFDPLSFDITATQESLNSTQGHVYYHHQHQQRHHQHQIGMPMMQVFAIGQQSYPLPLPAFNLMLNTIQNGAQMAYTGRDPNADASRGPSSPLGSSLFPNASGGGAIPILNKPGSSAPPAPVRRPPAPAQAVEIAHPSRVGHSSDVELERLVGQVLDDKHPRQQLQQPPQQQGSQQVPSRRKVQGGHRVVAGGAYMGGIHPYPHQQQQPPFEVGASYRAPPPPHRDGPLPPPPYRNYAPSFEPTAAAAPPSRRDSLNVDAFTVTVPQQPQCRPSLMTAKAPPYPGQAAPPYQLPVVHPAFPAMPLHTAPSLPPPPAPISQQPSTAIFVHNIPIIATDTCGKVCKEKIGRLLKSYGALAYFDICPSGEATERLGVPKSEMDEICATRLSYRAPHPEIPDDIRYCVALAVFDCGRCLEETIRLLNNNFSIFPKAGSDSSERATPTVDEVGVTYESPFKYLICNDVPLFASVAPYDDAREKRNKQKRAVASRFCPFNPTAAAPGAKKVGPSKSVN